MVSGTSFLQALSIVALTATWGSSCFSVSYAAGEADTLRSLSSASPGQVDSPPVSQPKLPVPAPKTADPALLPQATNDIEAHIVQLLIDGKDVEPVKKQLQEQLRLEKDDARKTNLSYLLSAVERLGENYESAIKYLHDVENTMSEPKSQEELLKRALLLKRIGDCDYNLRDLKSALTHYQSALNIASHLAQDSPLRNVLLESIVGVLIREKHFAEAEPYGKQLVERTKPAAASERFDDLGALFWAEIQLLGIYRNLGKDTELLQIRESVAKLFDRLISMRLQLESQGQLPELEELQKTFQNDYINNFKPQKVADYLWLSTEFKLRTLPVIAWKPQNNTPKAVMLCVHGLGLENRAFTFFGRSMAEKGVYVYAMDVRGFGAWLTAPGQEDVNFNETISDIGGIVGLLRERHPGTAMFLLGESMGGAIALRAAARYDGTLAGVISSVPSAELFQGKRMALTVTAHFLQGPNRPFRIGQIVTERASSSLEFKRVWEADSKAKMEMSPKELAKFAVFMRLTKRECDSIKKTPVFFVQGLKDRLVKPQGTYDLFDSVAAEDKNLFIIGTAEHLIFETEHQSSLVLNTLSTWIDSILAKKSASN